MQISIEIDDNIYTKLQKAGEDIQSRFNEYLTGITYRNSKQYQEDKAYFQQALDEVQSGKAELLSKSNMKKRWKFLNALCK